MTRLLFAFVAAILVAASTPSTVRAQSELVIYKEKTQLYHRAGCPVVSDLAGVVAMTRAQAEARGYKPHAECDPANPNAPPLKAAPPPVTVYTDGSKHYHRKDCSTLKDITSVKAARLEEAGKTLWPCPVCKPPRRQKNTDGVVLGPPRRGG